MTATTLKLEGVLLKQLYQIKPKGASLSAFVRQLLEQAIQRNKMIEAAQKYRSFLKNNPDEAAWLDEWEDADLSTAPTKRKN
ncbi:MAG: hypothetical protein HQM16_15490 [Deltaproteobacteria bacterium]|nr:hypothetical protein [Deltaproteobacteria bacterium]